MKKSTSNKQLEIIEVAGKILIEKGLKGLTTKSVAAEMHFSESAIYRHFKNKEEIIVSLLELLKENIETRLQEVIKVEATAEENLKAIFKSQFNYFNLNPHYIVAVLSDGLLDESEEVAKTVLELMQTKSNFLYKVIEDGKRNDAFHKTIATEDLLHIIIASFRLQMLKWKLSNFKFDINVEGDRMINNLIYLIKKPQNV